MNHLDGVQAVAYARLRLMDTDFNRTARQRKVISLAMDKAKNAGWSELNNILVTVLPQISTDLGIDDLLPLAKNISKYHIGETTGFPFSRDTKRIGKMDCVIPTTLESNVEQLHKLLFGDESYQAPASVRAISQKIGEDSGLTEVGRMPRRRAPAAAKLRRRQNRLPLRQSRPPRSPRRRALRLRRAQRRPSRPSTARRRPPRPPMRTRRRRRAPEATFPPRARQSP